MKLSELSPAEGSVRQAYRKGRRRQRQRQGHQEGHGSGFCFLRFCQGGYRGSWRKGRGEVK